MGHTGISVNIMLSWLYREDLRDREIPSHRHGGGGRDRRCGRRCDLHCIRYRCVASGSAGGVRRAAAAGPGRRGVDLPTPDQLSSILNTLQDPSVSVRQQGLPDRGRHPGSGLPRRSRTAKGRRQGQPAADVQHHQHHARRAGCRGGSITATGPHLAPTYENSRSSTRAAGSCPMTRR